MTIKQSPNRSMSGYVVWVSGQARACWLITVGDGSMFLVPLCFLYSSRGVLILHSLMIGMLWQSGLRWNENLAKRPFFTGEDFLDPPSNHTMVVT